MPYTINVGDGIKANRLGAGWVRWTNGVVVISPIICYFLPGRTGWIRVDQWGRPLAAE